MNHQKPTTDIEQMLELLKQTANEDAKIREPAERSLDQIQRIMGLTPKLSEILGDQEPRAQEYPVTTSFLNMFNNILDNIAKYCLLQTPHLQHNASLETCINLVTNIVFLRVNSRQFNKIEEKWTILESCISTYHIFISRYDPAEDGNSHKCSFNILSQILQDGDLFKSIMLNIEDAVNHLENDLI